jgi:outer membrane protein OmpA-like peptidoglycan-associated protein
MNIKNLILTTGLAVSLNASAQQENRGALQSFNFIELQGGGMMTVTNGNVGTNLIRPIAAFSVGRYFTPEFGMRLHVDGWQAKNKFEGETYNWKYATGNIDCLFNMSNLLGDRKKNHPLNVILLCGIGAAKIWDADEVKTYTEFNKQKLVHNLRAGMRLETNMAKPVGLSLEIDANNIGTHFQSQNNNFSDWMFSAMVGVSVRLGHKFSTTKPAAAVAVAPKAAEPQPVKETPAQPEVKKETPAPVVAFHEEIFYKIRGSQPSESDMEKLQKAADYLKQYPTATITVVGYADKGTGTPAVNMKYSEKRAATVKDLLVNKYGADAGRISIAAKGDTVQPFSENDLNRVSIIDGTTKK